MLHSWNLNATVGDPVPSTERHVARSEERNRDTIPTPRFARRPSTMTSLYFQQEEHIHRITRLINKDFRSRSFKLTDSPTPSTFRCWTKRFKPSSKCLFRFTLGGNGMDQRSGDGRFSGQFFNHRTQFMEKLISRNLRCKMRGLRPL